MSTNTKICKFGAMRRLHGPAAVQSLMLSLHYHLFNAHRNVNGLCQDTPRSKIAFMRNVRSLVCVHAAVNS